MQRAAAQWHCRLRPGLLQLCALAPCWCWQCPGSDGEWTEEEDASTPLDPVDPFIAFADSLEGLRIHNPRRLQVNSGLATYKGSPVTGLAYRRTYVLRKTPTFA